MNDDNILFILHTDDDRPALGIFDTIGGAILGAEHILKGDRCAVDEVIIGILDEHDFVARVTGVSGVVIFVRAIEVNECHSIDGIVTL